MITTQACVFQKFLVFDKDLKLKTLNSMFSRVIVLDSAASYCHISASNLLLAFVTKMNYTTTSAAECYQNKKVEFKNHLLDFPLFGRPFKGSVIVRSQLLSF